MCVCIFISLVFIPFIVVGNIKYKIFLTLLRVFGMIINSLKAIGVDITTTLYNKI